MDTHISQLVSTIDACFQKWAVASEHTRMGFLGKDRVKRVKDSLPSFPTFNFHWVVCGHMLSGPERTEHSGVCRGGRGFK